MERLDALAKQIAGLCSKYRGQGLTEQDTKNALIEPVLAELGWPKSNGCGSLRTTFQPCHLITRRCLAAVG